MMGHSHCTHTETMHLRLHAASARTNRPASQPASSQPANPVGAAPAASSRPGGARYGQSNTTRSNSTAVQHCATQQQSSPRRSNAWRADSQIPAPAWIARAVELYAVSSSQCAVDNRMFRYPNSKLATPPSCKANWTRLARASVQLLGGLASISHAPGHSCMYIPVLSVRQHPSNRMERAPQIGDRSRNLSACHNRPGRRRDSATADL